VVEVELTEPRGGVDGGSGKTDIAGWSKVPGDKEGTECGREREKARKDGRCLHLVVRRMGASRGVVISSFQRRVFLIGKFVFTDRVGC
jgi:hypothetical protein